MRCPLTSTKPDIQSVHPYPGEMYAGAPRDDDEEPSPEAQGCAALFVLIFGVALLICLLALWSDLNVPVRVGLIVMAAVSFGTGLSVYASGRRDD
jgi:hypothetical protein